MSEASKTALKRGCSPTHELMMDWILENPGGTLRQMGAYFDYSVPWLSTMMHSDAFKAHAAERLKDVHAHVTQDIPAKMRALAELSIERMTEVLEKSGDAEIIKDSFDKVMNRYGYAPGSAQKQSPLSPTFQQNNTFYLTQEQHAAARERLINTHGQGQVHPPMVPALPEPAPATLIELDGSEKVSAGS